MHGSRFLKIVNSAVASSTAEVHRAPWSWLIISVGLLLTTPKGIELFLVHDAYVTLMRDTSAQLAAGEWFIAAFLATVTVIALAFAIHLMLNTLSDRALLGFGLGIAAIVAIGAQPLLVAESRGVGGGNSFEAASENGLAEWIYMLAELARVPVVIIAAIVAGFGIEMVVRGTAGLKRISEAKTVVTSGTQAMLEYEEHAAKARTLPVRLEVRRDALRMSFARHLAEIVQADANRARAYLRGSSISEEVVEGFSYWLMDGPQKAVSQEVRDLVEAHRPPPLDFAALPPSGRSLPKTAQDELARYVEFLRQTYTAQAILKEMRA